MKKRNEKERKSLNVTKNLYLNKGVKQTNKQQFQQKYNRLITFGINKTEEEKKRKKNLYLLY